VTPLDISSVVQLERMIPNSKRVHSQPMQLPVHIVGKQKKPLLPSQTLTPKHFFGEQLAGLKHAHVSQPPTREVEEIDLLKEIETPLNPP